MNRTAMSKGLCRLAVLVPLIAAGPAVCDMVKLTNGLVYDPVTVTAVAGGTIQFRTAGGQPIKSLADVAAVRLTGETSFNRAEDLLAEGKYGQAAAAYAIAGNVARTPWKKTLIRCRHMRAVEAAGEIDEAMKLWLVLADEARGDRGVLELRPRKLGPKGAPANRRAISVLKTKADRISPGAYKKAVLQTLVDLYEREGRLKEAQAVQTGLAGQPVGPATSPGPGPSSSDRGPPIASSNAQVRLASLLLKQGEHQRVVSALEPILKRLNSAELPSAMFLLGSAQLALAEAEKDSKVAGALLLEAGLNLMRVVVFFPEAGEAAHSLFLAGRVNERLGNASAARAAYSAVLSRFSGSAAAKQAKAALEQVKDK